LRLEQGKARFAPRANEMVRGTISRAERAEQKRRAGKRRHAEKDATTLAR